MLHIDLLTTEGNILREDLTKIHTPHSKIKPDAKEWGDASLRNLADLCERESGVGVSASQIRVRENFFYVTKKAKFPNKRQRQTAVAHLCVNPAWEPAKGRKKVSAMEGCLSLPGETFRVERYTKINASWDNATGHRVNATLRGFAARVFQHEHDHLRGVLISDYPQPTQLNNERSRRSGS